MGTVMLGRMQQALGQLRAAHAQVEGSLWNKLANPQNLLEPATRAHIPAELLPSLTASLGDALWYAFLTGLVLMLLAVGESFSWRTQHQSVAPNKIAIRFDSRRL